VFPKVSPKRVHLGPAPVSHFCQGIRLITLYIFTFGALRLYDYCDISFTDQQNSSTSALGSPPLWRLWVACEVKQG
jgi:hypothetical protein